MDMSPQEYQAYVKGMQKKSPLLKDMALAFGVGGAICVVGQLIQTGWLMLLPREDAASATSISLVFLSAPAWYTAWCCGCWGDKCRQGVPQAVRPLLIPGPASAAGPAPGPGRRRK